MDQLEQRLAQAKQDTHALDELLADYLPFLKREAADLKVPGLEYDDILSISMLTFVNCIRQYKPERGGFFSFCTVCIKHRLIDLGRKQQTYSSRVLPLFDQPPDAEQTALPLEAVLSMQDYQKELERQALCDEIEAYSEDLLPFGITFPQLAKLCPKQLRSRLNCIKVARTLIEDSALLNSFQQSRQLPQQQLSQRCNLSCKTIEKHRKYIVAMVCLLLGDYPAIRAFLPSYGEVD